MKRCPDFLIIGFPRCGTTALRRELMKNPNINCLPGEGLLFSEKGDYEKGLSHFKEGKLNGEKTPNYILQKDVMEKIAKTCPDVKIIICMRHPIQAIHSYYRHRVEEFFEGKRKGINPEEFSFSDIILKNKKERGVYPSVYFYMKHIKYNVLPFFKKEQIHIVIQEEMLEDTDKEVKKVLNFLGVKYDKENNSKYKCIDYESKDYKKAVDKLIRLNKSHYNELFEFIGKTIKDWEEIDRFYYSLAGRKKSNGINIFGHRRSGNHFLIKSLELNFNTGGIKQHKDYQLLDFGRKKEKGIYIVRDGRDVLASCYHWWKESGESKISNIKEDFLKYSFSQYLRGEVGIPKYVEVEPGVKKWDIQAGLFKDPIQRWVNHVESYYGKIPFIKYEELKLKPQETLARIEKIIGIEAVKRPFVPVVELVGHHPRKGIIGDYKNIFSREDEELFWKKAGKLMEKLGYQKNNVPPPLLSGGL